MKNCGKIIETIVTILSLTKGDEKAPNRIFEPAFQHTRFYPFSNLTGFPIPIFSIFAIRQLIDYEQE